MSGKPLALPNEVVSFKDSYTGDRIFAIVECVRQSVEFKTNYYNLKGFPKLVFAESQISKPWFL